MTTDNIQPLIYKSTRGQSKELYFKDVIFEGLARDGGLYIPSVWPKLDNDLITEFKNMSYQDIAFHISVSYTHLTLPTILRV